MSIGIWEPLSSDHEAFLAGGRDALEKLLSTLNGGSPGEQQPLLNAVQRLLDQRLVNESDIPAQEAIGVLIRDEIVRRAGYRWVTVDDEYGAEPAIAHPVKRAVIFPLSAVTKRFEDGDIPFDLVDFVDEAIRTVEDVEAGRDATLQ
jgi:Domain of unknown function (DUF3806)